MAITVHVNTNYRLYLILYVQYNIHTVLILTIYNCTYSTLTTYTYSTCTVYTKCAATHRIQNLKYFAEAVFLVQKKSHQPQDLLLCFVLSVLVYLFIYIYYFKKTDYFY